MTYKISVIIIVMQPPESMINKPKYGAVCDRAYTQSLQYILLHCIDCYVLLRDFGRDELDGEFAKFGFEC